MDVYTVIKEEGGEEYTGLDNKNIAVWLYKGMTIAGVEYLEIIQ